MKSRKLFTGTGLLGKYFRSGTGPDTDEKIMRILPYRSARLVEKGNS
jgi:hypothetical protein